MVFVSFTGRLKEEITQQHMQQVALGGYKVELWEEEECDRSGKLLWAVKVCMLIAQIQELQIFCRLLLINFYKSYVRK